MPSIEELRKLLELDPTDAFVLYGLAQEYGKAGELDLAIAHYDRCIESDATYTYAFYHKARLLADHDRIEEAVSVTRAGMEAARLASDDKAMGELAALLDELE